MALDQILEERLKKLQKLKEAGVEPYPALALRTHLIGSARGEMGQEVTVVGRLRSLRPHGKITFADLEDESGKIQLFFSQELLADQFKLLDLIDLGDFLQVTGEIFQTQAGEVSVRVKEFKLLTKSIKPLPSAWYGLKDVEERNRKRYLDLVMNPGVRKTFENRSKIVAAVRKFLIEEKGYFEVESPVLQPLYGGTRARPFVTHHNTLDTDLYLRISNELYLKRLIVGGFEKVFEIGHTFRNEGMDRNHNPEFTMLETMEAYADYTNNMDLVEEMFEYVALKVFGTTELEYQGTTLSFKRSWKRVKLTELFRDFTGVEFEEIDTIEKAVELAKKLGVSIQDYMTDGEILLEIFEKKCTTQLIQPTFVYDYPADFYPLAKPEADNPKLVESFDIYVAGMEMGTNYTEQNNPLALREAWLNEMKKASEGNPETQVLDEDFLEALEYGMPPTSGIGPGLDRWIMVMTDSPTISDVILFPTMKPVKSQIVSHGTDAYLVNAPKAEGSQSKLPLTEDQSEDSIGRLGDLQNDKGEVARNDGALGITREEAYQLLTELIQNKNLVKHGLAVEAIMRSLARRFGESEDEWGIVGLLHDADYEVTDKDLKRHTLVISEKLKERGVSERIIKAIQAHSPDIKPNRENLMERSVYCADELSGLITAVALVRPDKKLSSVDVEAVMKKFPQKAFAAGAKREQIEACKEELGIELEEFVGLALEAMQGISEELGL